MSRALAIFQTDPMVNDKARTKDKAKAKEEEKEQ